MKALTPPQRLALAHVLHLSQRARPTRRVWIPKSNTPTERRPLGIPTLRDRAEQALAKLALEPEWEAKFEPNSYGFRPGRSSHDAVEAIFGAICKQPKYVLDADIAKCFDRINHQALLRKLRTFARLRRAIRAWLQAGVISPLLANIALHGLETAIRQAFPLTAKVNGRQVEWQPQVIRYADDFVVLHRDAASIERAQQIASAWLADMGLELKPSKTRITHTLHDHHGHRGFDFLGFRVLQHPVGRTQSGKLAKGKQVRDEATGQLRQPSALLGFKTIIAPSPAALRRHAAALSHVI